MWVALWGDLSAVNVVGGLMVAIVVAWCFPCPALRMHLHVRPLRLAWLVLHFLGDVVVASAQVAWTTLQFRRQPRNAVIEVDLRTHSDFVLTVVAEMVSLVPGSLVVEARRSTHTLFLHVLDARDQAGVDKMRATGLRPRAPRRTRPRRRDDHLDSLPTRSQAPRPRRELSMNAVLLICVGILGVAALLLVARISLGPTMLDRVVALDVLVAVDDLRARARGGGPPAHHHPPDPGRAVPARVRRLGQRRAVHSRQRRRRGGEVMSWADVADVVAAACLVLGALLTLIAAIGILRFPDVLTRMHSATKPQVLGLLLILVGLGLRLRDPSTIGLLALVAVFQLVTSPIASHMVGRASFRAGQVRRDLLVVDELSDVLPGERATGGS